MPDSIKQVSILNIDQWRGPSSIKVGNGVFTELMSPLIDELERGNAWELKAYAELCKWSWKQWEMRYVFENIGDVNGKLICDVGGYLNPMLRLFSMIGATSHMYDLKPPDRSLTSGLSHDSMIRYEKLDVCSLDCPDDTFDAVYSISTLEHVANKRSALSEMIRVTKPGGIVLCTCDAVSHYLDYQLEDPFFTNFPLNEYAIRSLLGVSVVLPDKHHCRDYWKEDEMFVTLHDRWPDWKFISNGDYTALGFVLLVKSSSVKVDETPAVLESAAIFDAEHSARNHLVWGFHNADPQGYRFTRDKARLRLWYDAEQHDCFYLKGFYPSLSRKANNLRIRAGEIVIADIPFNDCDQFIDLRLAVPDRLVTGVILLDIEIREAADIGGNMHGILINECGFTGNLSPFSSHMPREK